MRGYKAAHGIEETWHAGERVMVCISASPTSTHLIRAALEAIAFEVRDVVDVMAAESAATAGAGAQAGADPALRVDGTLARPEKSHFHHH